MKSFFTYMALTVIFVLFLVLIRTYKGEVALPLSVCIAVSLMGIALSICVPIFEKINNIATPYSQSHLTVLFKSVGIAMITATSSDICRDAGETAIASKVELLGKCEMLVLSFPLMTELIDLISNILAV